MLVYSASAGSGKTFTLAARYIALLMEGESFDRILAVTFTQKATAEMKQRIMAYLYAIGTGTMKEDDAFLHTVEEYMEGELPKDFRRRAYSILTDMLNRYDRMAVNTIDSFFQMILAGLARHLHLRANFEVDLEEEMAVENAVDQLLSGIGQEDKEVQEKVYSLVNEHFQKEKNWDIRVDIRNICKQLSKEAYLLNQETISMQMDDKNKIDAFRHRLRHNRNYLQARQRLENICRQYAPLHDKGYLKKHAKYFNSYYEKVSGLLVSDNVDELYLYAQKINSLTETKRQLVVDEEKWRACCVDDSDAPAAAHLLIEMDEVALELIAQVNSIILTEQHLSGLCLLNKVQEMVRRIEKEKNASLLSWTPITLRKELATGDALFLLEKAGVRFRHIMIDEFQDTSALQWELFKPLVCEMMDEGGTVLIVGDVKQSIYRWRNGNWELLHSIDSQEHIKRYFKEQNACIISKNKNFRSRREIIRFNLSLFQYISRAMNPDGHHLIQQIYEEHYQEERLNDYYLHGKHEGGYVQVNVYPHSARQPKTEMALADMMNEIKRLVEGGQNQSSIAILVRTKGEARQIIDFLKRHHQQYEGLDVTSAEALLLGASVSVNLLVEVLRYLMTNNNRSLFYIISRYQNEVLGNRVGWETIRRAVKDNNLAQLLPKGMVEDNNWQDMPLYELMETIARMFLYDTHGKRTLEDDNYVFCFFDEVAKYVNSDKQRHMDFLEYWENHLRNKSITGALEGIRIMTIHKSKGLEFDNVFLPFVSFKFTEKLKDGLLWCHPQVQPFTEMEWVPVTPLKSMAESVYADEYLREILMLHVDSLNVLYVACTRAKNRLYLTCQLPVLKDSKKAAEQIPSDMTGYLMPFLQEMDPDTFNEQSIREAVEEEKGPLVFRRGEKQWEQKEASDKPTTTDRMHLPVRETTVPMMHLEGRMAFRQSSEAYRFFYPDQQEYDEEAVKHGTLLHLIYSEIATQEETEEVIRRFRTEGYFDSLQQEEEVRQTIAMSWNHPLASTWFDGTWTLFRECSILQTVHDEVVKFRPDRVMVKDGTAVVIDFKFGKEHSAYDEQVRRYMRLMHAMNYTRVKGYLWYIANDGSCVKEVQL